VLVHIPTHRRFIGKHNSASISHARNHATRPDRKYFLFAAEQSQLVRAAADDAARIQELFLAGRREEAIAAMPDEALLQGTLVGTPASIRQQWEAGDVVPPGVTGTIIGADRPDELELIAELTGVREDV